MVVFYICDFFRRTRNRTFRGRSSTTGCRLIVAVQYLIRCFYFVSHWFCHITIATAADFQPPNRFRSKTFTPASANNVADVRRKESPMYASGFGRFKNFATVDGMRLKLFLPTGCFTHLPFSYLKKNLFKSVLHLFLTVKYFLHNPRKLRHC